MRVCENKFLSKRAAMRADRKRHGALVRVEHDSLLQTQCFYGLFVVQDTAHPFQAVDVDLRTENKNSCVARGVSVCTKRASGYHPDLVDRV